MPRISDLAGCAVHPIVALSTAILSYLAEGSPLTPEN